MTLLFMTFAKWTHATQPWKTGSLLRFFSHLAVFGALWEGCELWGCTFVKVHSPVRESEPSKVIARRCLGRKQTLLLLFLIFLQTCTHIKMCTATDFLKSPKCFFFFFNIPLFHLHLLFRGLMCESFICLFDVSHFLLSPEPDEQYLTDEGKSSFPDVLLLTCGS